MPTTRVLYLEPDPCLRRYMTRFMDECDGLEVVASVGSAVEALAVDLSHIDAAVVEVALRPWDISGFDVALTFRRRKPIGVVFFTYHPVPDIMTLSPASSKGGWSVLHKASELDPDDFTQVVQSTARGLNIVDPASQRLHRDQAASVLDRLTERQRQILTLASSGLDGNAIAGHLGLAAVTVRQELSRIYEVLVPDAGPGRDLRTTAVVRYLQAIQLAVTGDVDVPLVTQAM